MEPGHRVLVKVVVFDGKHKIADRWENEAYCVLDQPSPGISVYVIQPDDKEGPKRTLHRNLLLPINHLRLDDGTTNASNTPDHPNNTSSTVTYDVNDEQDDEADSTNSGEDDDFQNDLEVLQIVEEPESESDVDSDQTDMVPVRAAIVQRRSALESVSVVPERVADNGSLQLDFIR